MVSAGTINTFPWPFLDGQEMQSTVNESAQECFLSLESISQIRTATRNQRKMGTQEKGSLGPFQKWMKRRAVKKGNFLCFQDLFQLDRGKLAKIILNDIECLSCEIPLIEHFSVLKARWEKPRTFDSLGNFQINGKAHNSAFRELIAAKEMEKNGQEMSKNSAPNLG